jgi:hypothetical protein
LARGNKPELDRCPKAYLKWSFVVLGMVIAFVAYAVYSHAIGGIADSAAGVGAGVAEGSALPPSAYRGQSVVLAEHVNEEDGYETPARKRLEDPGERYSQEEQSSAKEDRP